MKGQYSWPQTYKLVIISVWSFSVSPQVEYMYISKEFYIAREQNMVTKYTYKLVFFSSSCDTANSKSLNSSIVFKGSSWNSTELHDGPSFLELFDAALDDPSCLSTRSSIAWSFRNIFFCNTRSCEKSSRHVTVEKGKNVRTNITKVHVISIVY